MMMQPQPATVYETVQPSTAETTIADVLLGAVSMVLGLAALALVLGIGCAAVMIAFRRFRGDGRTTAGGAGATRLGLDASTTSGSPTPPKSIP